MVAEIDLPDSPGAAVKAAAGLDSLRCRLLVTLLTVLFYFYPSLLTTSLSLFACYHIDRTGSSSGAAYPQNARV